MAAVFGGRRKKIQWLVRIEVGRIEVGRMQLFDRTQLLDCIQWVGRIGRVAVLQQSQAGR